MEKRALAHLEALLEPVSPSTPETATACLSAIAAYAEIGVLKADEALAWRERLRAQLDLEPERRPRCSRRRLLRVVAGPAERMHRLRIARVELYADDVVLQWHNARRWADGPATRRVWNDIDIETAGAEDLAPRALSDDVGTRYVGGGRPNLGINGGGWGRPLRRNRVHSGGAASMPRRLHVRGLDIDL